MAVHAGNLRNRRLWRTASREGWPGCSSNISQRPWVTRIRQAACGGQASFFRAFTFGFPPSLRNGSVINVPTVAAEGKVRKVGADRVGPAADIHRLKALGLGHINRPRHVDAEKID